MVNFSSVIQLFSHSAVQCLHIREELDNQLWILETELWNIVTWSHGEGLSGLANHLLCLEGLRVDLLNQIKLFLIEYDLLTTSRLASSLRLTSN